MAKAFISEPACTAIKGCAQLVFIALPQFNLGQGRCGETIEIHTRPKRLRRHGRPRGHFHPACDRDWHLDRLTRHHPAADERAGMRDDSREERVSFHGRTLPFSHASTRTCALAQASPGTAAGVLRMVFAVCCRTVAALRAAACALAASTARLSARSRRSSVASLHAEAAARASSRCSVEVTAFSRASIQAHPSVAFPATLSPSATNKACMRLICSAPCTPWRSPPCARPASAASAHSPAP